MKLAAFKTEVTKVNLPFYMSGKFYDHDYGNEIQDFVGRCTSADKRTEYRTWMENGERAWQVIRIA